jgi:AcrR family transcriptional regulator
LTLSPTLDNQPGMATDRITNAASAGGAPTPEPPVVGGWGRRRIAIAREIEDAALRLFASHGVEAATVERIAAAANISERTVFRYFASREDILAALPVRALANIAASMAQRPPTESILEAFIAAVKTREPAGDEPNLALWGQVILRSPEAAAGSLARVHPNMVETFRDVIAGRLAASGRDPLIAGPLAAALGGIVGFVFSQWVLSGGETSLAKAFEEALGTLPELAAAPRRP